MGGGGVSVSDVIPALSKGGGSVSASMPLRQDLGGDVSALARPASLSKVGGRVLSKVSVQKFPASAELQKFLNFCKFNKSLK